jgi:sulfide:quinone oxidoreductase
MRRHLLVLGAGTAGTACANRARKRLPADTWTITVVDTDDVHMYQPGFLFLPFGGYSPAEIARPRKKFLRQGVNFVVGSVEAVQPSRCEVELANGVTLPYDYLVIATGTSPRPDQTPGMLGEEWRQSIHEFYTYDGAVSLRDKLRNWDGGRLVVHIVEMPIKCPVAPLEFAFLADSFFRQRRMRDRVELSFVTPLSGAFTKPISSELLGSMLDERKIALEPDFAVERIDTAPKRLVSYDGREVGFDLLVTVPLNMGADFVARSGLGDELNYVRVDAHTLQSSDYDNIFAVGDAASTPASKAGSVAHFAVGDLLDNMTAHMAGAPLPASFDGHANCYVEVGDERAMLIDFNYETEPLPGKYPIPKLGPFSLLHQTRMNHWGKLAFRWMYWNMLLPGRRIPLPEHMSMAGKTLPEARKQEM